MGRRLVLCVGNPDRGDDAVGRRVAALLQGRAPAEVEIVERSGEAALLLEALEGCSAAIIVDASLSGAPPGAVRRFDLHAERPPLADERGWSSHGFGLAEAIGLARALGGLPPACVLFAIEGESFAAGAPLSRGAEAGAAAAAQAILAELALDRRAATPPFSTGGKVARPCPPQRKTL